MTSRLEVTDLAIGYEGKPFLSTIHLTVDSCQVVALLGPSGSGKSTLLETIAGILPVFAGRIRVDGVDVTDAPIHLRHVGMVFQDPMLFPHLTVLDNIGYGLRRAGASRSTAREKALTWLEWVGLEGLGQRRPHQLSGGQAQRVALARTLAPEPAVVLLDEPFSALDLDLRRHLAKEVSALLRSRGVAAVHVTHDRAEAEAMGDRVVNLADLTSG